MTLIVYRMVGLRRPDYVVKLSENFYELSVVEPFPWDPFTSI